MGNISTFIKDTVQLDAGLKPLSNPTHEDRFWYQYLLVNCFFAFAVYLFGNIVRQSGAFAAEIGDLSYYSLRILRIQIWAKQYARTYTSRDQTNHVIQHVMTWEIFLFNRATCNVFQINRLLMQSSNKKILTSKLILNGRIRKEVRNCEWAKKKFQN